MRIVILDEQLGASRSLVLSATALRLLALGMLLILFAISWGGYRLAVVRYGALPADSLATLRTRLDEVSGRAAGLREQARRDGQAYSARLAALQARLLRMEAIGERLAAAAKLDQGEFDFRQEPALGGPFSAAATPLAQQESESLARELDLLGALIEDRERQLEVMESLVSNRRLVNEVSITGKPVKSGYLSSVFGRRADPFDGSPAWHKGVDFTARRGTEVIAVASGVVSRVGYDSDYGKIIEIRHSDGYSSRYAHNSEFLVKVGDVVKKGQPIARVGSTGRSTGSHVHFEVLSNGRQVDPMAFINSARASG